MATVSGVVNYHVADLLAVSLRTFSLAPFSIHSFQIYKREGIYVGLVEDKQHWSTIIVW